MARQNNYPIFENNSTVITAEFMNGLVNNVKTLNQEDGVFDISIANAVSGVPITYNSLELALSGTSIPVDVRKGGMAIKFINSSTNKYEQWNLKALSWSTNISDWQGVDNKPTIGSNNLVTSDGIYKHIISYSKKIATVLNINDVKTSRTIGIISQDGSITTLPGGVEYVYEVSVNEGDIYVLSNIWSYNGYKTVDYVVKDSEDNVLELGTLLGVNSQGEDKVIIIPSGGSKLFFINCISAGKNIVLQKLQTKDEIVALSNELETSFKIDIPLEHGTGTTQVLLEKTMDFIEGNEVFINNVQRGTTAGVIYFYDKDNTLLLQVNCLNGGGVMVWQNATAPSGTTKLKLQYKETNDSTRAVAFYISKTKAQDDAILKNRVSIEDLYEKEYADIELQHGDKSDTVNFSKKVSVISGQEVRVYCMEVVNGFKVIRFLDFFNNELSSIAQTGGSGSIKWYTGIAPSEAVTCEISYRENSRFNETIAQTKVTSQYVYDKLNTDLALTKNTVNIELEHTALAENVRFEKTFSVIPGATVYTRVFQYLIGAGFIFFYSDGGSLLLTGTMISQHGGPSWQSFIAPEGTSYATVKYIEKAGQFNQTQIYWVYDIDELKDNIINNKDNSIETVIINGDSTSQGLGGVLNNAVFNNDMFVYKGGVGGENVLATAARQGSIPVLVMPFTIPASSKKRWTNNGNHILADGDDPQVVYSSSLLYHTQYDENGIALTPSVSPYTKLHFAPTAEFKCNIGGVDGILYSLPPYHVEDGEVIVDGQDYQNMYFHRLEDGEEVVIDKVTEVIPKSAPIWHDCYQVNLMGTNQGFGTYKNEDYVLLGNSGESLVNAMEGDTKEEKLEAARKEWAKNLFDIQKRMARNTKSYLIIGYFCEVATGPVNATFYDVYEDLCDRAFGNHFFNARKYLKDQAWKDLGITLSSADRTNIAHGLPPYSLFGNGDGQATGNPHLTTLANKALANQVALRIYELGWTKSYPTLYELSNP